jgi:hypothetical protein
MPHHEPQADRSTLVAAALLFLVAVALSLTDFTSSGPEWPRPSERTPPNPRRLSIVDVVVDRLDDFEGRPLAATIPPELLAESVVFGAALAISPNPSLHRAALYRGNSRSDADGAGLEIRTIATWFDGHASIREGLRGTELLSYGATHIVVPQSTELDVPLVPARAWLGDSRFGSVAEVCVHDHSTATAFLSDLRGELIRRGGWNRTLLVVRSTPRPSRTPSSPFAMELVVKLFDGAHGGTTSDVPVTLADVGDSVRHHAGQFTHSRLEDLVTNADHERGRIVCAADPKSNTFIARAGRFELRLRDDGASDSLSLHDLRPGHDPAANLAHLHPDVVARLRLPLTRWRANYYADLANASAVPFEELLAAPVRAIDPFAGAEGHFIYK